MHVTTTELVWSLRLILIFSLAAHPSAALQCHECSEQFSTRWEPRACQLNVSLVPVRDCLSEQTYCVVERVTVKGIVTSISRNCGDDCLFGCVATGFGITSLTCTSCCNTDRCNTMDTATQLFPRSVSTLLVTETSNFAITLTPSLTVQQPQPKLVLNGFSYFHRSVFYRPIPDLPRSITVCLGAAE
ncbi:hypothetical protein RRG08_049004 [Elysia crispata]|uniref:Snake toxin/toxin-like domain-containing protein n=1 Tax=Elysia crispata TaxID=231223 RepID=A0AAE0XRX9_9GAST|nr:hypothetical protein RRG08_049004 [Elysia crispata]